MVRTTYDDVGKKPRATVVGRMRLEQPVISDDLRKMLTDAEVREAHAWIEGQHRTQQLREEFAAVTLAESLELANSWIARNKTSPVAAAAVASILPRLQVLRKTLKSGGFLD